MICGFSVALLSFLLSPHQQASSAQTVPGTQHAQKHAAQNAKSFDEVAKAADEAREADRDEDAIRLYREGLQLRPAWKEGMWYLSTLLYQKERFAEARDVLRQFVSVEPKAGPAWALLGMSEYQTREYSRALDHLKHGMREGWEGRKELAQSVFYFVSVLLTRFEQYDDSMSMLFAMVKSGEQPELVVEPLGLAALRLPLLPSEIPPDLRDMIRMAGQGSLAIETHNQAETERLFGAMVTSYPDQAGVHFLYGAYLMDVRPEEGIREMKKELAISPSHVGARLRLAEEYIKEQKFDEAQRLAEEAVQLDSNDAQTHMVLGEVLVGRGDLKRGLAELESARKLAPDSVRTHWDLLRAYSSAGRNEDAKREKEEIERLSRAESQQTP